MATRRATFAFVAGLILTTAIAAILAFVPAGSVRWSSFAVAVAVPVLLVAVLAVSVIQITMHDPSAPSPSPEKRYPGWMRGAGTRRV